MAYFGTNINIGIDFVATWSYVSGRQNLINAIIRRLSTTNGGLALINDDPDYGYDVRSLLQSRVYDAELRAAEIDIAKQLEQDDRIEAADATIAFKNNEYSLTLRITDVDSTEFQLVFGVDQANSLTLLNGL